MEYISKSVFLEYLACPTLAWMSQRKRLPKIPDLSNKLLAMESKNVHTKAREFFCNSVRAKKSTLEETLKCTQELLSNPQIKQITQATFAKDGYCVSADIIERLDDGTWKLYEVKSGNKYKVKYANDMSFTAMIIEQCGLKFSKYSLLCLSDDYRLGMDISKLFKEIDITSKVEEIKPGYFEIRKKAYKTIKSFWKPKPFLKRSCKNCPMFDECMGKGVKNSIFDLSRMSIPNMEKLISLGADTIDKVPDDFELTEMQQIIKECVLKNKKYISENLQVELSKIQKPYYYLDFESVTTIMPLYEDVAPHHQLLTQFSLDRSLCLGKIEKHFEYIADPQKNSQRQLAEKLIEYLGNEGSIITYANFEAVAIKRLASLFPDLQEKLLKIVERIVDLEILLRKNYYDINFHGKSSIKKVLPVLVPQMSYKGLAIGQGGDASAAFAFMAMGLYDEKKMEETKKNLLVYCAQDTLAMVLIHKFLCEVVRE